MSSAEHNDEDANIVFLNEEEAAEFFADLVRMKLGITVEEFVDRYRKGEYKGACSNSRLLEVLMCIPAALRKKFAIEQLT